MTQTLTKPTAAASAPATAEMTAEAFLSRLAERGIDYVFANAGTDFAPIIEALARKNKKFPRFVTVPHENVAMAMANGYYRLAGKPAAVMVHVTVGTANTICGLMNMARDNVPVLLCAGRTPVTETGHDASRNGVIHWGQESFDQGGMVREFVKWEYELRSGQPVGALVDRALDIAMTEPRGPVYMCLPREVLADDAVPMRRDNVRPLGALAATPAQEAIDQAAQILSKAKSPMVITSAFARTPEALAALSEFADKLAISVAQPSPIDLNLQTNHPMFAGFDLPASFAKADTIIVIDSGVPWIPKNVRPADHAKVIHMSVDPLVSRHPFREFETDLLVAGDPTAGLRMLLQAVEKIGYDKAAAEARRTAAVAARAEAVAKREAFALSMKDHTPIHPAWLAHCINKTKAKDAIVMNELGTSPARLDFEAPQTFFSVGLAGGLGSGIGSALGIKLAAPEREVIACVGDGSYMFGNPLPTHFVGRSEKLATLTIVANNHQWLAVRMSTLAVYPDGAAAKANVMPVQDLNPSPDFEKVVESCGGYGESVKDPSKLEDALRRALEKVRAGIPVVLNVHTQPGTR
ncbi:MULTISPECIES: thiamine pyrophosphate-requiring protein [unclassified Beijerinckia]|uniref:thiamine pyrophosphate-requiring protein n=1 Tax=unclassified Beijerinckia TaxID=2638183 RepID=UPI000895A1C5|nr:MULTISPECIES: thiamine pyrophosphate-requiring protein [unclassified Beijerinckia]MDH7795064.1 acetolactate synthase-1/2/3 large subunit [Beijerinckia sp. GAS462]SEB86100.1 acetolactate synthase-1/2/3 large subunit [Beijerinckia sp. 28-YEA-48]